MSDTPSPAPKFSWLKGDPARIAKGFDRVLLYEFDMLEEHRKFAVRSFHHQASALEQKIEDEVKTMSQAQKDEYYDHMQDDFVEITEIFPRLQWYAQFLIVYSTFEDVLNRLCAVVKRRSKLTLSVQDLDGQGISRCRNYLVKVVKVEEPFSTKEWNQAILLGKIRNAIAHRNGDIENEPTVKGSLSSQLTKVPHLTLKTYVEDDPSARILLSEEFVRQAVLTLRKVVVDVSNYPLYVNAA